MVERDRTFSVTFSIFESDPVATSATYHEFCTRGVSLLAPSFEIDVTLTAGQHWRGAFFGGREGLSKVVNGPDPEGLIGIAGGVAYTVPVTEPESYEVLELRPVKEVLCSVSAGVVVLIGWTSVLAVGGGGNVKWVSCRLVSEGFAGAQLTADSLVVRGFDASQHRDTETTLMLSSGEIQEIR